MNWLTGLFKITCKDTSPLISEMMDHSLPLGRKLRVRVHLGMCKVCQIYQKQLKLLRTLAKKISEEDNPSYSKVSLTEECKERMKEALKNNR